MIRCPTSPGFGDVGVLKPQPHDCHPDRSGGIRGCSSAVGPVLEISPSQPSLCPVHRAFCDEREGCRGSQAPPVPGPSRRREGWGMAHPSLPKILSSLFLWKSPQATHSKAQKTCVLSQRICHTKYREVQEELKGAPGLPFCLRKRSAAVPVSTPGRQPFEHSLFRSLTTC